MKNTNTVLREWLNANGGRVTFSQFMAAALYHPNFGYYTRHIKTVGRAGDFSTAGTLHPLLARAIARWLAEYGKKTLGRCWWNVIEIGAGSGEMLAWIRKALPLTVRWRVRRHVVETSPTLRELQQSRLAGCGVRWHETMQDALRECGGRALIYSNELVDAFPCVQLVRHGDGWREIFLVANDDGVRERDGEIISKFDPQNFSVLQQPAANGQRCELHESYRAWLASWLPLWERGAMLTVDYGDTAENLYLRRPHGSLRAYFHHQRREGTDIYQRMGRQDLTADVNFTDLQNWGEQQSLRTEFFQTQADFITNHVKPANSDAEQMLLNPDGAGLAFKVLCQTRQ